MKEYNTKNGNEEVNRSKSEKHLNRLLTSSFLDCDTLETSLSFLN